jgi:hypothetical protein
VQAQQTEERNALKAESLGGLSFEKYDFLYRFPYLPEELLNKMWWNEWVHKKEE